PQPQLTDGDEARQRRMVRRHQMEIADDEAVGSVLCPVRQRLLQRRMREPTQLREAGPEQADPGSDPQQPEYDLQAVGHEPSFGGSFYSRVRSSPIRVS